MLKFVVEKKIYLIIAFVNNCNSFLVFGALTFSLAPLLVLAWITAVEHKLSGEAFA